MKTNLILLILCVISINTSLLSQKKFAQIENLIPTPNEYRNAAGSTRPQLLSAES